MVVPHHYLGLPLDPVADNSTSGSGRRTAGFANLDSTHPSMAGNGRLPPVCCRECASGHSIWIDSMIGWISGSATRSSGPQPGRLAVRQHRPELDPDRIGGEIRILDVVTKPVPSPLRLFSLDPRIIEDLGERAGIVGRHP